MTLRNTKTGEQVEKVMYPAYADFQLSTGPLLIGWYTWEAPIVSIDVGAYYPEFLWQEVDPHV